MNHRESVADVLSLQHIVKRFRGVLALDGASIVVRRGTVHALLGENGAGKTTLMRVAYGMLRPDAGRVLVDGPQRRFRSSANAIRVGIGMVHQHYALVPAMTVTENVALGGRGRYDARASAARVRALANDTGLALDPDARVDDLSVEAQQRVEIVKALARDVRTLILDEPTAVLAPSTAATLLAWLRQFADAGHAVVLITHKLREALGVADDITVLRHGRTVLATAARSTTEADLASAMLGTPAGGGRLASELPGRPPGEPNDSTRPALVGAQRRLAPEDASAAVVRADHLSVADTRGTTRITDASFAIRAGEIVGIAAVEGQGQHELLRAIAGRLPIASGRLVAPENVGFIPEDRQRDGLILDFAIFENVGLRDVGTRRGLMPWRAVRERTRGDLADYDIRAESGGTPVGTLSGGNQQKVVLARELSGADRGAAVALVAENPTRGLDIQATAAVHLRLRAARNGGTAIALYASDLDEVLSLADRVLVVSQGTVREVAGDREAIGRAMLGL